MGEWSKSIGEKGEKVVKFLFEDILNFNSLVENETITCNKGEKHKISEETKNRTTHGLDGLISYRSPVEDYLLDIAIISSKYTALEYPNSPVNKFKSYLKELAYTIECFNNSKLKNDINQKSTNIRKTEIIGILVWLSNASSLNFDLVSKVDNILLDNELKFDRIIFLDNCKVTFLYESIFKSNERFGSENVKFVYHNSSLNLTSLQAKSYGNTFPINYLYSDIIPLRIEENGKINLVIFINDDFDEEYFVQILNFAKSFDHLNAVEKTIINYRNFDELTNENLVKAKLVNFNNFKLNQNLFIKKFPSDFRNN